MSGMRLGILRESFGERISKTLSLLSFVSQYTLYSSRFPSDALKVGASQMRKIDREVTMPAETFFGGSRGKDTIADVYVNPESVGGLLAK